MSKSIACIVYQNGKLFIAKRRSIGDMGGKWEFPGGKIEDDEAPELAIKREMFEEFSVNVSVGEKIGSATFIHSGKNCSVDAYVVQFEHDGIKVPFVLTEHTEYKWVNPLEIKKLDFVDSDLKLYPYVLDYYKIK
ncbi:MAG: NUDIX domain-containing protein [Treponema sp.]|nr:NUDIX domain-containing protein [Treponema sp.]